MKFSFIFFYILTTPLIYANSAQKKLGPDLKCEVVETPMGSKKKQKRWKLKAPFLTESKEPSKFKSRYLQSLNMEIYASWAWAKKKDGARYKELTAHIDIIESENGTRLTSFASGGNFENSKEVSLITIFTRANKDALAVNCYGSDLN